ncbi:hypothetical protein POM88_014906 [Heracleum sosnowskyi]|uniref:FAR1 domain-containing protein n=1 Tax=Heracleum sosnowskyi TaxID=360622 RepID=A0AAD8ILA1_9APIA|nr:hypothetical protein POM88_014906 [Heracleum sosnowskyi]
MVPYEGIEFSSHEDAYNFYNQFSLIKGFSIRKSDSYKFKKSGEIIRRKYCCNKEGYKYLKDKREEGKDIRRRRDEREGCKAELVIHVIESGMWKVNFFSDNHNHEMILSPNKKIKLRSHDIAHSHSSCKNLMDQYHSVGVGPAKMSQLINVTSGSSSNVITSQQCNDYLKSKRKNNTGKECMTVIHKFMERQANDPAFYYAIEISEDQVCHSVFWADGRARKSYLQFHDKINSSIQDFNETFQIKVQGSLALVFDDTGNASEACTSAVALIFSSTNFSLLCSFGIISRNSMITSLFYSLDKTRIKPIIIPVLP